MTLFHAHIAVTLDGRIARPDGGIDWLVQDWLPEGLGFEAFYAAVEVILMGRGTYEAARAMGDWPYADKRVVVLTSRPLADLPPGVSAHHDLAGALAGIEASGAMLCWVEGGGQVIRGLVALGRLDRLEMAVIPVILGQGIPLFPEGTPETRLALDFVRPWTRGAIHLRYSRPDLPALDA